MGKHEVAATRRLPGSRWRAQPARRPQRATPSSIQRRGFRTLRRRLRTAAQRLKAAGFLLVVITNQPDVGRGTQVAKRLKQCM